MRRATRHLAVLTLILWPAWPASAQNVEPGVLRAALASAPAHAQPPQNDPLWDGIALGAVIGAGTSLGLTAISFARCDDGCEAPQPGQFYAISAVMGGAVGGLTGWLIDRARKPKAAASRVSVAPVMTKPHKGVAVTVTF